MRSRHATWIVTFAAVLFCSWAAPAPAQTAAAVPDELTWSYSFENGVFWGQVFGGLSAANDKETFKKLQADIWRNTYRLTLSEPGRKSWSGQTSRATAQTGPGGVIQFGGGIGISRFGFPKEAEDFFGESGFTVTTIMDGARYVLPPQPKFLVFVQGQAGIEHSFEENAFAIAPAGGVIVPVRDLFLTVTAGLRTAFYQGDSSTAFELGVGLTFPFCHQ